MKKISEVITKNEIESWEIGYRILVVSQTGTGKSYWVKNDLYNHCLENNKKILLLSNRNALKEQNIVEIGENDIITIKNYQSLESLYLSHPAMDSYFSEYDYIVFDECHYLLSDSQFNRNTDILLKYLRFGIRNKIFIFLTATPQSVYFYSKKYDKVYSVPKDYSFIETVYFYKKREIIENIIYRIPQNEKIIYFTTALEAFEMSLKMSDSTFICSMNNAEFGKRSSKSTLKEIIENNHFSSRLLCSTKVLDNGVNIIDSSVKHVIVDMIDPIDVIQCLGRRRIADDEKITVYLRDFTGREIYPNLNATNNRLKLVKELNAIGPLDFQVKYARKDFDNIVQNDYAINQSKLFHNYYLKSLYGKMIGDKDKRGYQKLISSNLGIPASKIKNAEDYFETLTLSNILDKYLGKRLFSGKEQDEFKIEFFNSIFSPKKTDYRRRGIQSINSIIEEDDLPYSVITQKGSGVDRNKRYWVVLKSSQ